MLILLWLYASMYGSDTLSSVVSWEWGIILDPPYIAHRILNRSELQCIYCMMCLVAFTERRVEEVCVCDGGIEPHKYPILASSNMFNLMESNW